jgi:hypothetical protein
MRKERTETSREFCALLYHARNRVPTKITPA